MDWSVVFTMYGFVEVGGVAGFLSCYGQKARGEGLVPFHG